MKTKFQTLKELREQWAIQGGAAVAALELAYNAGYSAARGNEDLLKLQKRQEKAARHGRRIAAERELNKLGLSLNAPPFTIPRNNQQLET
jgi:hypothetical protein